MKRRDFMKSSAIAVFGAGLPLSGAMAQNRYAKYAGQTVVFSIPAHPHYDAMLKILPRFTKETGIKVETDRLAMGRMKEKQLLEMAKAQGDYDLGCYVVMWKGEYVSKDLIHPLDPFFQNAALVDPAYDIHDIVPIYLENLGLVGGPKGYLAGPGAKLYGLPYGAETSVLAYRRDLFSKHDLKPPANYDEFRALLPLVRQKTGIGALASRGQAGHQAVHAWLLHLNPLGGSVFDDEWHPRFNDEAGLAALKFLQEVVATGPAGIPGYGQGESNTAFLQGQAAMYLDSTLLAGLVNDPAKSRVAGKVGWALHPMGTRRASQSGGLGLAVAKNARNADAAFLLMQWLTSKAQDKAVTAAGGVPIRNSTLGDAELMRKYPEFVIFKEALKYSNPDWRPIIAVWDKINVQALGVGISEALTGKKTAQAALDDMVPQVTQIMREAGYKV
ncbi:ABC transporter substrate-binding protein [Achromobacter sp. HZ01]|jgi:multiple sugar transport system substrate-binding protein|uniref:ABC transporter substrate-binding protein n=1 Tax=Achromobacter pulmonis TaxID=1389932 RepID=A0A2N8KM14_9BURK|nr:MULTISPECIES: extracellular solute-binding protein [Achromobacter]MBO9332664.1 extracellular solute-binding protein [Achromobacter xylosoxidans]PND34499.1 ABC transporter substrate-binding protein [Achromobacter pulmonis]RAP64413.1 ABC transporter substrate-binding protein [Achromobacter sp. HZ01]